MKHIITPLLMLVFAAAATDGIASARAKKESTVTFCTSMHCAHCEKKIIDNVSFEKGVIDLKSNLATKELTVIFNPEKTDTAKLAASIRKLGYTAQVKSDDSD